MEIAIRAIPTTLKLLWYKLVYGRRLNVPFPQSWGKGTHIHIEGPGSRLTIGKKNVTRENVVMRVQNGKLEIGDKCFFNLNVSITCLESIRLGAGCQFGNNVVIVDHDHNYKKAGADPLVSSPVIIGQNVWIGANSVILRGAEIGDGAVIAAGSVVKGKVPSGCVYYQKRESVCAPVLSEIRK